MATIATIADIVKHTLEQQLQGAHVEIDSLPGAQKVSGFLVWDGFQGMEQIDRQRHVRRILHRALGTNVQRVSTLLTYTPNEFELMG